MRLSKKIGNNLRRARKAKGYLQKELAARLLLSPQQYDDLENGFAELNYHQIVALCEMLDITPNELFDVK